MAKGLNGGNTLSYMGVNAPQPPNMTQHDRAPDVDDYQSFELGDFWINQAPTNPINHELYILVAKVNKQATWVMLYPNIGTASVISLNSLSGVLNLTTGDNISITPSGLNIALAVAGTTQYAIQVGNASGSLTSLGLGTAGQVLTSNGVGNFPIWQSLGGANVTYLNSLTGSLTLVAGNNTSIMPTGSNIYIGLTGTTQYCIQLGNAAGGISDLGLGTSGAILRSQGNGSNPAWSIASYPNTVAKGDILVGSASNTVSTISGAATAGYVLTASGAGTVPSFQVAAVTGVATLNTLSGTLAITAGNNISVTPSGSNIEIDLSGTTQYALQVGNASNNLTSLALGTSGYILTSGGASANPSWINYLPIANGGTNTTGSAYATDGIFYFDGTKFATTTAGTSGYFLQSNGPGVAPTWAAGGTSGGITTVYGNSGSITGTTVTISGGNNISTSGTSATLTVSISGTTQYALQVGNSTNSLSSLSTGSSGQYLISGGTSANPSWTNFPTIDLTSMVSGILPLSNGGMGATSFTQYGILLGNGTTGINVLAPGTAGYILSAGSSANPVWTQYVSVAHGGTGVGTLTAHGVLLGEGTSSVSATSAGTAGQILVSGGASADPGWITTLPIANGGTNQTTFTTDGVVYFDGTHLNSTAVGTAGQVLTSNGTSVAPTFQAIPSRMMPWNTISSSSASMSSNNGYIVNYNLTPVTLSLPSSPSAGDVIYIVADSFNSTIGFEILQVNTQIMFYNGYESTLAGPGHGFKTNTLGASCQLIFTGATEITLQAFYGTFTAF